jgi:quercetin dioxygenase-like cupin family protein
MPLFLNIEDVEAADLSGLNTNPADRVRAKGHDMKRVHGTEAAFAISLRKSGYHSYPHIHDFEQLNYIQEGEMWFFIVDKPYHVKKGDFLRIPRNAIHWSWVKTKEPCLCYEVFCPPPPARKDRPNHSVGLFDEGEEVSPPRSSSGSYYIDLKFHGLDLNEIEARPAVNRRTETESA